MKKHFIKSILYIIFGLLCVSCSREQKMEIEITIPSELEKSLDNTSWKLSSVYNEKNGQKNYITENIGDVISFSLESWGDYNGVNWPWAHTLFLNGKKTAPWWYETDNGVIRVEWHAGNDARTAGKYSSIYGPFSNMVEHTSQKIILYLDLDSYSKTYIYTRASGYDIPSEGGNSGSGNNSYEKPDIEFYDFDATTNSITVRYKINNRTEAQITSAKINYGTTSSCSSSVTGELSGVYIIGRIKNLKKGTTYYVKCTANGKGGTVTTNTFKVGTLY